MRAQTQQAGAVARIGPNVIIQAYAAMRALGRDRLADAVLDRAGLGRYIHAPPTGMVPQTEVVALFDAVSACCSPGEVRLLTREAGLRTGDYILANRIPVMAQRLLKHLPRAFAAPVLLSAIKRHAWTFAGDGVVTCSYRAPLSLSIGRNPIAMPGCPWHVAVLGRLFGALVDPGVCIVHTRCCAMGAPECRFDIVHS